jgi:hypothetical protein
MKLLFLLVGLLIIVPKVEAQTITQTWIDPCTNAVQSATFNLNGPGITIVYRNEIRTFTAQQALNGELMAWINQVTAYKPCPTTNNPVVNQTTTQTASSAASGAASAAAGAAAGASTSSPPPSSGSTTSSSGGQQTSSSSGDSGSSSSSEGSTESNSEESSSSEESGDSEESSEDSEESEEESDSEEGASNPVIVASNLTFGQNPDGTVTSITTIGVSQSSLMGDKSYGVTGIIWSDLNQFAVSGAYTKLNLTKGELQSVSNYSFTAAYLQGNYLTMAGYTEVLPDRWGGVMGVSAGALMLILDGVDGYKPSFSTSVILFAMPPTIQVTERFSMSPQLFVMGSPVSYDTITGVTTSNSVNAMIGSGLAYSFTRRFGLMGAYRMQITPGSRVLNFLMIGTSVTF